MADPAVPSREAVKRATERLAGGVEDRELVERWRVLSATVKRDYGRVYPSQWTVELEGWQKDPPPVGDYLVAALDAQRDPAQLLEDRDKLIEELVQLRIVSERVTAPDGEVSVVLRDNREAAEVVVGWLSRALGGVDD